MLELRTSRCTHNCVYVLCRVVFRGLLFAHVACCREQADHLVQQLLQERDELLKHNEQARRDITQHKAVLRQLQVHFTNE